MRAHRPAHRPERGLAALFLYLAAPVEIASLIVASTWAVVPEGWPEAALAALGVALPAITLVAARAVQTGDRAARGWVCAAAFALALSFPPLSPYAFWQAWTWPAPAAESPDRA